MAAPPVNERCSLVTPGDVHREFERLLHDRKHMGLRNLIGDVAMEPRNPFQQASRKPKKWIVALGGVGVLAALIVYYFHLR
jgi:CHASE1-domain containing sensor protein